MARRHVRPVVVAIGLLVGLALGPGVLAAPLQERATAGTLRSSVPIAVAGEGLVLSGSVPPRRARAITLQRLTGGGWTEVRTTRTNDSGRFSIRTTARATTTTYRVLAPRARLGRTTYPQVTTPKVKVTTVPGLARVPATLPGQDRSTLRPDVSADGRYVAYATNDNAQVAGDSFGGHDVFVLDRVTGRTTLASVSSSGAAGNGPSWTPSISDDGRYVAFESLASTLVPDDNDVDVDVFVRDLVAGTTTLVSAVPAGSSGDSQGPSISGNGAVVAFSSDAPLVAADTNEAWDVYAWTRSTGQTRRLSVGPGGAPSDQSSPSTVSVNRSGGVVAFDSDADGLVAGDANGAWDVFVRDVEARTTTRVNPSALGDDTSSPAVNGNGRVVAYQSDRSDLVAGDSNERTDVFATDLRTNLTQRLSQGRTGTQWDADSRLPSISRNGRFVSFESAFPGNVAGDTEGDHDVYRSDRLDGTVDRLSLVGGQDPAGESDTSTISADGRWVAWISSATDLVAGDENERADVFVGRAG